MKKYLFFPVLMGILVFSGCGITEEETNESNKETVAEEVNVTDEMADNLEGEELVWKTYVDDKLGFSINYPENWVVSRPKSLLSEDYWFNDNAADNYLKKVITLSPGYGVDKYSYDINIYLKQLDLEEQKEAIISSVGSQFDKNLRKEERSEITFDYKQATSFTVTASVNGVDDWVSENILLEGDRYLYLIPVLEKGRVGYSDIEIESLKEIHNSFKLLTESKKFSAEDVAYIYYNNYINAIISSDNSISQEEKDLLAKDWAFVTRTFVGNYSSDLDKDPVLCSSEYPKNLNNLKLNIKTDTEDLKVYSVEVAEGVTSAEVSVLKVYKEWKINKIVCPVVY